MKLKYFVGLFVIAMMFLSSGCGSSTSNNFVNTTNNNGNGDNTIDQPDDTNNQTDDKNDNTGGQEDNQNQNENGNDNTGGDTGGNTGNDDTGGDTGGDTGDDTGTTDVSELEAEILANNPTVTTVSNGAYALEVTTNQEVSNVYLMKGSNTSTSGAFSSAADDDDYNFRGTNAAVRVSDGAVLTLTKSIISTDAAYANAVFSYGGNLSGTTSVDGDKTTVKISDCVIYTYKNGSGGIMTTGGGITEASNLRIITQGGSSAPIRTDRGGGTVTVNGGYYEANGAGSPAIYSTADVTVSNAELVSNLAQGVVIEGKNSVTLSECDMTVDNTDTNGDKSTRYQSVMIYQSYSGDAAEGKGAFTMTGGSITNKNGDIFFITNTTADITLNDVDITNNDTTGNFLRAELAGWSTTNGGNANVYANDQLINGNIIVDESSALNLYLADGSAFSGAVNTSGAAGDVYVEIESGSKWTLSGNSYVSGLTCEAGGVDLNGYTLTIDGTAYTANTASTGTAIEFSSGSGSSDSDGGGNTPPDGGGDGNNPPEKPGDGDGNTPPSFSSK